MTTPCENCPYRKDAPRRLWDAVEFQGLLAAERDPIGKLYACHKQKVLATKDRGFCAGWLLDQKKRGVPSIALRLKLATDKSGASARALEAVNDGGHEMFSTVKAMCQANGVRE